MFIAHRSARGRYGYLKAGARPQARGPGSEYSVHELDKAASRGRLPVDVDRRTRQEHRVELLFRRLVEQGWTDAIRKLYPDEKIYTFWDYFRNAYERDAGLRIDHFLLSPAVDKRLKAAGVDRQVRGWEKTSDHAPTWIEISDK